MYPESMLSHAFLPCVLGMLEFCSYNGQSQTRMTLIIPHSVDDTKIQIGTQQDLVACKLRCSLTYQAKAWGFGRLLA